MARIRYITSRSKYFWTLHDSFYHKLYFFHKNTILHLKGATKRVVLVAVFKYGVLPHYHDVGCIHECGPSIFRIQLLQRMLQFCYRI